MKKYALAVLAALLIIGACSNAGSGEDSAALPAACGTAVQIYESIDGERIYGASDGVTIYTGWRTADGFLYLVSADKNGACIVHIGRPIGPFIPV